MIVKLTQRRDNNDDLSFYIKEEDIKIIGGYEFETRVEFKILNRTEEMICSKIEYPTSQTTIDTVSVNQSTDMFRLTSVLDKMNETLEKISDKLS